MRYAFWVLGLALLTRGLWAETFEQAAAAVGPKSGPGAVPKSASAYIPTLDVVRDKCTKEHPKKCLKRRCVPAFDSNEADRKRLERLCAPNWSKCLPFANQPIDSWPDKDDIRRLKKVFGDDWQAARDTILAAWEVLLYSIETGKIDFFVDLFEYPTNFILEDGYDRRIWEVWQLHNRDELKRIFWRIINPTIKDLVFLGPRCSTVNLQIDMGAALLFSGKIRFNIKKLTAGPNKGRYQLIFNEVTIESNAFLKDLGKTSHELKRRGCRSSARSYPQPGSGSSRTTPDL